MTQEALDFFKGNLDKYYLKFFTEKDNKWMYFAFEGEIFKEYKTIPDIELSWLEQGSVEGEIDVKNIQTFYSALQFISPSQASDERLWAGLCCGPFYAFMRNRSKFDKKDAVAPKCSRIRECFFLKGSRPGYFRNLLSKLWWVGYLVYDASNKEHYEKLKIIGTNDISSKISEIFYSYTYSSNKNVLNGIIMGLKYFKEKNIYVSVRNHLRPTVQELNLVGSVRLLDIIPEEEIAQIVIDKINDCIEGKNNAIEFDESEIEENEDVIDLGIKIKEKENSLIDEEIMDDEEISTITYGHLVSVKPIDGGKIMPNGIKVDDKYPSTEAFVGKTVGDIVEVRGYRYQITAFRL